MAERPVFISAPDSPGLVREARFNIEWRGGFASIQKKRNVAALHQAAEAVGLSPLLEVSTKSDDEIGRHLSAFHLKVQSESFGSLALESAYQGSKVFEHGGPFRDLYAAEARAAKRDTRLHEFGKLVGFRFDAFEFPLEPRTVFYDWLYINSIFPHREWLRRLDQYAGFTDIEFNPAKSVNCQARSCALFVSLTKMNVPESAIRHPGQFVTTMKRYSVSGNGRTALEGRQYALL